MQSQSKLLDDLARVASGAFGVAAGMRSEAEARLREQFERILSQMDLVSREDYDTVYTMAQNAREEQEAMAERMAMLEARVAELEDRLAKAAESTGGQSGARSGTAKAGGAKSAETKSAGSKSGGKSGGAKSGKTKSSGTGGDQTSSGSGSESGSSGANA